ncbi:SET domain-containing protein [Rickenella mellea]|uniref:SET domain-containing protein n=1 Tax=Rickenella mellea TaxID=50990 RepID=A0A4Y7QH24_9AGAM|nr:SET domain-containing protein [Rickenella mellea]
MSEFASLARSVPSLASKSSRVAIKPTLHAGFGVFAAIDLEPGSPVLRFDRPVAYTIFRTFRREVCAHCFAYNLGQYWKIKDLRYGVVFCTAECQQAWLDRHPPLAREAFSALESFIQLRARKDSDIIKSERIAFGAGFSPDVDEITEAWRSVHDRAALIISRRLSDLSTSTKAQRRALQEALQLPIDDTDIIYFVLSGIISHLTSPSLWSSLESVAPNPRPYTSKTALLSTTYAYLQLLAILPTELLPFTTPAIIHGLMARDACNSFGIWSGTGSRDGDEFLGYGIWPDASFFNHSCQPSVTKTRVGQGWEFSSTLRRVVAKDDELCISYLGEEEDKMSVVERRKKLWNGWGFECMCPKCNSEAAIARN